jgi:hypothetical protein
MDGPRTSDGSSSDARRASVEAPRGLTLDPRITVLVANEPPKLTATAAPVLLRILLKAAARDAHRTLRTAG